MPWPGVSLRADTRCQLADLPTAPNLELRPEQCPRLTTIVCRRFYVRVPLEDHPTPYVRDNPRLGGAASFHPREPCQMAPETPETESSQASLKEGTSGYFGIGRIPPELEDALRPALTLF